MTPASMAIVPAAATVAGFSLYVIAGSRRSTGVAWVALLKLAEVLMFAGVFWLVHALSARALF